MAGPLESDAGGQRDKVPVVRVAPILPWQEPLTLSYRVVELPVESNAHGKDALPPVNWIYRPPLETAVPYDERDASPYPLAEELPEDQADQRRRRRDDARALEQLIIYKQQLRLPRRRVSPRETHWYQCLAFPFRAWRLLFGLAAALALATTWLVFVVPGLHHRTLADGGLVSLPFQLLIPFVLLAYGCGFLQCVLNGAVAGNPPHVSWPGRYLHIALRYTCRWLFCFLAGPALLAAAALVYWIHCGELEFLDRLILAELGLLALGYWLFALVAVTRSNRLRDANPLRVAELAHRLRYRAAVAVAVAALLVYAHGRWVLAAVAEVHEAAFGGWLLLTLCWLSGLACAAFLLRMLGLWCYRCVGDPPATVA